jgi:hypothetical protein
MRNENTNRTVLEVDIMRGERFERGENVDRLQESSAHVSQAFGKEKAELRQRVLSGLDDLAPDDRVWIETVFGLRGEEDTPLIVPLDLAFKSEKTKRILRRLRSNK